MVDKFADIRCYYDNEVPDLLNTLRHDRVFSALLSSLFKVSDQQVDKLWRCQTVDQIQHWLAEYIAPQIEAQTGSIDIIGLANLEPNERYVFVSNHQDILMDPFLVNLALYKHAFKACYNAIGDNLLGSKVADIIARLNRCFVIPRGVQSPKAMFTALKLQSQYIRHLYQEKGGSMWIAQQEGRSKDGKFFTNPALLKMLALGRDKGANVLDYLNDLHIVPLCIGYEWDPCDIDKANQLLSVETKKQSGDDLASVMKSLQGHFGAITLHFGEPITVPAHEANTESINIITEYFAKRIDTHIHRSLMPTASNYAAASLLNLDYTLANSTLTVADIQNAQNQLIERLRISDKHHLSPLQKRVLCTYAGTLNFTDNN